jgi:hypothetical protein
MVTIGAVFASQWPPYSTTCGTRCHARRTPFNAIVCSPARRWATCLLVVSITVSRGPNWPGRLIMGYCSTRPPGQRRKGQCIPLVLPWGTPAERERSERIAASIPTARIPERQRLDDTARLIAGAAFVVGIDTGLMHLAAALSVPLVAIFTASRPDLTGPVGQAPMAVVGGEGEIPTVAKVVAALERIRG